MNNIYHQDIYQFNTPVSSYWEDTSSENLQIDKLTKDTNSEIVVIGGGYTGLLCAINLIENHNNDIFNLCKTHKVKSLYAFGSVLTDKFNSESDVDLIVDFENLDVLDYGDNYYNLKFSLENILKRSIDLLEEKAIKNPYFRKSLNQNKVLIYG